MSEAKTIKIEIEVLPVARRIARRGDELERQIPIRGLNYRGMHKYEIWNAEGNHLEYSYTWISVSIDAPKLEEGRGT